MWGKNKKFPNLIANVTKTSNYDDSFFLQNEDVLFFLYLFYLFILFFFFIFFFSHLSNKIVRLRRGTGAETANHI